MLQVVFSNDKNVLYPLYGKFFGGEKISGANYVLLEDDAPIGVCRLVLTDTVEIDALAVEKDDKVKLDFLLRTILFKLSFNPYVVKVKKTDESLRKFGFTDDGEGGMVLISTQVKFPSDCGCNDK